MNPFNFVRFQIVFGILMFSVIGFISSGCNLYSFVDKPNSEEQILSAGRACLDDGDWECAQNYYSQLRGGTLSDLAWAEDSFAILEHYGVSITQFAKAFASSSDGKGLGRFSNMITANAGATTRLGVFSAYAAVASNQIKNTEIKGFTRMVVATAIAAELLAEAAGSDRSLIQSDLGSNPTQCLALSNPACASHASCLPGTGGLAATGTALDLDTVTTAQFGGTASYFMLDAALQEVKVGLTELNANNGRFGTGIGNLVSSLSNTLISLGQGGCYVKQLLSSGIGL